MKKESLKQQAYAIIKAKIINCEYPPNTFLNEEILREELKVSRTPIRDALSRLEQENLIRIIPKKGIMISELSINEINMIYEARMLIEPFTISTYGHRVDQKQLRKLRTLFSTQFEPQSIQEIYKIDDDFHQLIINASQNKYLWQTFQSTHNQNRRLRILSGNNVEKRLHESRHEHVVIIDFMLDGNYAKAAQAMTTHLDKSKDAAFSLLIENGGWALT